jgi:large subunit ribosomal protein L4
MKTYILNKFGNIVFCLQINYLFDDYLTLENWVINLSEIIRQYQSNNRQNTIGIKTRALVSGSSKKPWRQKGTGRARHGSKKSPIWVSGGVAHGPSKNRIFKKKINKKTKFKFLIDFVGNFMKSKKLYLNYGLNWPLVSSKHFVHWIQKFKLKSSKKIVFFGSNTLASKLSCRNIAFFKMNTSSQFNVLTLFKYDQIFMTVDFFNYFFSKKKLN